MTYLTFLPFFQSQSVVSGFISFYIQINDLLIPLSHRHWIERLPSVTSPPLLFLLLLLLLLVLLFLLIP